jgi:hypothetical protein
VSVGSFCAYSIMWLFKEEEWTFFVVCSLCMGFLVKERHVRLSWVFLLVWFSVELMIIV